MFKSINYLGIANIHDYHYQLNDTAFSSHLYVPAQYNEDAYLLGYIIKEYANKKMPVVKNIVLYLKYSGNIFYNNRRAAEQISSVIGCDFKAKYGACIKRHMGNYFGRGGLDAI